ncbi:hypothetical protein V1264_001577 [Littorina saxatilis]|uniref:Uncharacterized protein n=1 Tax=Littorina saxatilis TaxID=31220 RepID=A0AAN9C1Q4_9CAEN
MTISFDSLCDKLTDEVCGHLQYYQELSCEGNDLKTDLQRFIVEKQYNTDTIDLVLAALCNALPVVAIIYQTTGGQIQEFVHGPGRPGVNAAGTVRFQMTGEGLGAHYNPVVPCQEPTNQTASAVHRDSDVQPDARDSQVTHSASAKRSQKPQQDYTPMTNTPTKPTTSNFSAFHVRPFPKAAPRQMASKGRKRRKSAILTDTPEKQRLSEEKQRKPTRTAQVGTKKSAPKTRKRKASRNLKSAISGDSSEDDDCFCLVCCEPYSNSRPNEQWAMCVSCNDWSHEECTEKKNIYVFQNCASDSE